VLKNTSKPRPAEGSLQRCAVLCSLRPSDWVKVEGKGREGIRVRGGGEKGSDRKEGKSGEISSYFWG